MHGLLPTLLVWSDDSTLVLSWGQTLTGDGTKNSTSSRYAASAVWTASSSDPRTLPATSLPAFSDNANTRATDGVLVTQRGNRTWWLLDPHNPLSGRAIATDQTADVLVLSPDHRRLIGVRGHNVDTGRLAIGTVPSAGDGQSPPIRMSPVPAGRDWFRPLAWVDADHVAALRRVVVHPPDGNDHVAGEIDLVDIRSGAFTKLVSEFGSSGTNQYDLWLASSYFGAPVVHAAPPPSPRNQRQAAVLGGLALIGVVVAAGLLWRRRGRRA